MHRFLVFIFVLLTFAAASAFTPGSQAQSASDPNMCFKSCIETYGSDKKQACALQCGFGKNTSGAQGRDCGSVYKQCLTQCGTDGNCKNACRKQRTQCY